MVSWGWLGSYEKELCKDSNWRARACPARDMAGIGRVGASPGRRQRAGEAEKECRNGVSKRLAEGLASHHWSILVGLLGVSSTFLRLGCTDLKDRKAQERGCRRRTCTDRCG